jgi:hypothetical protein
MLASVCEMLPCLETISPSGVCADSARLTSILTPETPFMMKDVLSQGALDGSVTCVR